MVTLDQSNGTVLYTMPAMKGTSWGKPLCTKDGIIILTTRNENLDKGHFSVFNLYGPVVNYTYTGAGDSLYIFGAVRYYYNPVEGNYPEGAGNTNDLFMWVASEQANDNEASCKHVQMFAFQLPMVPGAPLSIYMVGNVTTFFSDNPPVFANNGYLMYQAVLDGVC
jgi:hypothetical protein